MKLRCVGKNNDAAWGWPTFNGLCRVVRIQSLRERLELNPTLSMLRTTAKEVLEEDDTDPVTKQRIQDMLQFVAATSDWYEQIRDIPTPTLTKLMKLGQGITKLVKM